MKELMKELKLSGWDNGTLFVITDEYAYPFCGDILFAACSAPTMAEIERAVDDFTDDDMRGYAGFPLTDDRVVAAKTIYTVTRPDTGRKVTFDKVPTEKFIALYADRDDDELRIISNNQRDPSDGELLITACDNGVVLKREQLLDLAARINAYFTTN